MGLLQGAFAFRNRHPVDGVGHQTAGQDVDIVLRAVVTEPRQRGGTVLVGEKNIVTAVAALGEVMGDEGKALR